MTKSTVPSSTVTSPRITIGLDLGDRTSHWCVLSPEGQPEHGKIRSTEEALTELLEDREPSQVVLEVGTHSPWMSRLVRGLGHECLVADARRVALISKSIRKTDRTDAETLARLARADLELLNPITHRHEDHEADLAVLRARRALVENRTRLVNHVRGVVKSVGRRIPVRRAGHLESEDRGLRGPRGRELRARCMAGRGGL